jgi:DNA-nicking Smr family endonuclease
MGSRCLMIIHGRGLKSHEGPVLKNCVVNWLSSGILSSYVLAFCSARPCDGGTGAVYVLLKARPDKKKKIKRTA